MPPTESTTLEVKRDDWSQTRLVSAPLADLAPGQVRFEVDHFALTSNNISYALAGDMIGYWKFFPADEGWGRIPVMGFCNVVESEHDQVEVGTRCFGFYPMSTHLVVQADQVSPLGFFDVVPHRAESAPAYRQYSDSRNDALYEPDREAEHMLLRGLFMTSFLVDDFVADNDFFGARSFVIGSASSKTAMALAFLLSQRGQGQVVGLTSPRNQEFVESLGTYDLVLPYGDLKTLPPDVPTVFVDHAGDGEVVNKLHHHFGDHMKYSCMVGATHWDAGQRDTNLPGAEPTFFFAPGQMQKRAQDWGPGGLQKRLGDGMKRFVASSGKWLTVVRSSGPADVERVYRDMLQGRTKPSEGHVLSMWKRDA